MSETLRSGNEENSADNNKSPYADNHGEYVDSRDQLQTDSTAHDTGCKVHGDCSDGQQLDGGAVEILDPAWFADSVLKTEEETQLGWYVHENSDPSNWKGDDDDE